MISISDIIWGDVSEEDTNLDEEVAEMQKMSYNCLEMCCSGRPVPSPTSFIGCR